MPRLARLKGYDCAYHIMVRSISEVCLYKKNLDKDRYLKTLKKYQDVVDFKAYGYCLMDTHAHFTLSPSREGFNSGRLSFLNQQSLSINCIE